MNILYLLKILNTNKVSELVGNIDLPPIDINLAIWDAKDRGDIDINEAKGTIKALKDAEMSYDEVLANKLLRVVQHYAAQETNITRGRLNSTIKDPMTERGYPWHEYLMALQGLIDTGVVIQDEISVSKTKKRPYHKFAFLGLPENPNEEWNAREVNKWMTKFDNTKIKR